MQVNNAPDTKDRNGNWVKSYITRDYDNQVTQLTTRAGAAWKRMIVRCKDKYQITYPTYEGVVNGFKDFQEFAEWCQHQYGYLHKEGNGYFWHLDKDLKVFGNKVYSPETCMFVPQRVNNLLNNHGLARGDYPLGTYLRSGRDRFTAQCNNGNGVVKHLGQFASAIEAHQAWQRYKIDLIRKICVEDEEIRNHLELVPILLAQAARIEHDVLNNIETK